jgi:hypothetical protein
VLKSTKCLSIVGTEDNAGGWLAGEEERKRLTGSMIKRACVCKTDRLESDICLVGGSASNLRR